ncbi:Ca-activated chloride channel family protein [Terriglobus roseus]|uniref:Ca-activated chloride channel family protein n=1 Tax=Terriglobus roseus TaxID=392734 RepID=A0A1G7PEK5_9BACT|nr:Ca-activated chloride channel family protein [Terriglobus roseus]
MVSSMVFGVAMYAQDVQVETLHVTSRLVEVSAVVTDKTGEPHTGLTKDDFTLKQDGKEQTIQYFSQGNELPLTFIVMIDTSGSQRTFIDDEQRACDVFFETVLGRPQDRAALIEVNANVLAHSDLTNDPGKLHLALYGLHYEQRAANATRLNDAIYALSKNVLANVRGRKAIILISDGGDNGSATKRADAIAEAQRDNVPIYAVSYSAWSGLPQPAFANSPGRSGGDPGMENLQAWSSATGGHVYQVSAGRTLKHIFEDIGQELRTQYEIGYSLPSDTTPKQFHKLELKTKDKSLRVQARNGFFTNP